jgi:diphthamide synthase (EF-2-diphthine--ammonia ligase)
MVKNMKRIVLLSGGKDSTATLFKVLETHTKNEIV